MRLLLSEKARADLLRIYRYLQERERSSLAPGLRCLVVGFHLLFYTVGTDEIVVIRIIDGRMDVDEEFYR